MRTQVRARLGVSFAIVVGGLCCAVAHAGPHNVVDLRNKTDGDGLLREVSLCARPSPPPAPAALPGHMFIGFGQSTPDKAWSYFAVGHTTSAPLANTLLTYTGLVPSVPGYLASEKYTATKEQCLVFQVNKDQYEKALLYVKSPLDKVLNPGMPRPPVLLAYALGSDDCMGYSVQVINAILPPGKTLAPRRPVEVPMDYVRRIIDTFSL